MAAWRHYSAHFILALVGWPAIGAAQVDSLAAVARARYREAVGAAQGGNWHQAHNSMKAAAEAWPTQVAYLIGVATAAAHLADTAAVARWLTRVADLGLTTTLSDDSALARVAAAPMLGSVRARLFTNGGSRPNSVAINTSLPADFYPEGVDYDPESNSFYLASVRKRTVVRIGRDGAVKPFLPPVSARLDAALAVRVDPKRDLVWVTTRGYPAMEGFLAGDQTKASVVVFNRHTGERLASALAPNDGESHWFGDLIIDRAGAAYLTDSESPVVFKAVYRSGQITLTAIVRHRYFRSLQGLAFDASERRLYLADYSHGLLQLDLAQGTVRYLAPPPRSTLLGIDGMVRSGHSIYAVQNGVAPARVIRIDLDRAGPRVIAVSTVDRNLPVADEPTLVTVAHGQLVYVANSQWEKYGDDGRVKPGAHLASPVLLSLPLRPE